MHCHQSRRSFLKTSLFATLALLSSHPALAALPSGKKRPSRLHLYNTHTCEQARVVFLDQNGRHNRQGIARLNWLLRCHYTNEQHPIDPKTLDFLKQLDNIMGGDNEIHIISAYRSPRYNKHLLREGHKVAKNSLHLSGKALDIRIPGTDLAVLHKAALSLGRGGVGYYPDDNFIHIDSGKVRAW